ncbi:MAG: cytochrome c-type biogenesis protein CcmH [Bryobacteraceae bacterium]|jgi:cytochrome c-type biogenesis protein CcmH
MKRLLLCFLLVVGPALAALPDAGLSDAEKVRYHRLCQNLIAPCCWSQPVDVHSSPAAEQAREEVAAMILAGRSDRQILDSFIARHGERILAEPEGIKSVVLTTVPIVMLICGGVFLVWFLLHKRARVSAA